MAAAPSALEAGATAHDIAARVHFQSVGLAGVGVAGHPVVLRLRATEVRRQELHQMFGQIQVLESFRCGIFGRFVTGYKGYFVEKNFKIPENFELK